MAQPKAGGANSGDDEQQDGDLGDMLQELRILLQGAQVLTAFLTILPFNQGFAQIDETEKWVYLATFLCSITSLILFTAPAAHHSIQRPLRDRAGFRRLASRIIVIALVPLSLALSLSVYLVVAHVLGVTAGVIASGVLGLLILAVWWILALVRRGH